MAARRELGEILTDMQRQFEDELAGRELLVLVFDNAADREEFVAAVREAKPGMCEFHVPARKGVTR